MMHIVPPENNGHCPGGRLFFFFFLFYLFCCCCCPSLLYHNVKSVALATACFKRAGCAITCGKCALLAIGLWIHQTQCIYCCSRRRTNPHYPTSLLHAWESCMSWFSSKETDLLMQPSHAIPATLAATTHCVHMKATMTTRIQTS
jgi:hypothetical protein